MDDDLDALRARVARHSGVARGRPLLDLAVALQKRYWEVGVGSPGALRFADEAIAALDEAIGYFEEGAFIRGQVAAQLGAFLATRHVGHQSPESDRERGISWLEEALTFPQLPPMQQTLTRLQLGQLLVQRSLHSGNIVMRLSRNDLTGSEGADARRAVALLQQVVDEPGQSGPMAEQAQILLDLAKAAQGLTDGAGGGLGLMTDLSRVTRLFTALRDLQRREAARPRGTGFGHVPSPFDFQADALATSPPLTRPVMVAAAPMATATPLPAAPIAARPRIPAATLRAAFHARLPVSTAIAVFDGRERPPVAETVDELVAIAGTLVGAPGATAADQLLFAIALYLRGLLDDGGGWGEAAVDDAWSDVQAAEDNLLAAKEALVGESAETVAVAIRLARALDAHRPGRTVHGRLDDGFKRATEALRTVGAGGLLFATSGDPLMLSADTGRTAAVGLAELPERLVVSAVASFPPVPLVPFVSFVRSGRQLVELARRGRRELGAAAVFVAGPRGDREFAEADAMRLRRAFFPRAVGLGRPGGHFESVGTSDELRARLDASLLHLGCGVTPDGGLELAEGTVLTPSEIAAGPPAATGGLAVLPPAAEGTQELAEALLATRFTGVIGFRAPVPDHMAALLYFLLYSYLIGRSNDAVTAVAAVHRWLADPRRTPPEGMPARLYDAAKADLDDGAFRDALIHHGL